MADKEKVIKGLECCNQTQEDWCGQCPYYNDFNGCMLELRQDALALLKEQEAVEPYRVNTHCDQHWKCSHCDSVIGVQDKYCRQCGHALKWKS